MARLVLLLLAGLAALLGFASTRPSTFTIRRSLRIPAQPETLFTLLNDFHQFARWSPWEKKDPAMQRTFIGPASGPGASYAWSGNRQVGQGEMRIRSSVPHRHITMDLRFIKPFAADNTAEFTLTPDGDGATLVQWSMSGRNAIASKVLGLFINMDDVVGKDFEDGLAALSALAQAEEKNRVPSLPA